MENSSKHISIMSSEIVEFLQPDSEGSYLDATFGGGGHSRVLLEASAPSGAVVGIDRDENTEKFTTALKGEYGKRFRFEAISYIDAKKLGIDFDGAVMDLGLSSDQLENGQRGFSFQKSDEPLDLRFGQSGQTAAQFLNQAGISQIEKVFREYAQDRYWKSLADKIVTARRIKPIQTVTDFITVVGNGSPAVLAPLFQALRIQVNDELVTLERGLKAITETLRTGGVLVVISFHSLEDKIVKEFFRAGGFEILTKKPITPNSDELAINPRSRSAKLRAGRKI